MSIGESAPVIPPLRPATPAVPAPADLSRNGVAAAPAMTTAPAAIPQLAPAEFPAPADLDRRAGRWERLAWYAGTILLSCLLVAGGYRLDRVRLNAPLYYDMDSLLILPMVKATMERGSHWRNERLGYPGIQELHDFPVIDHLHFGILWLLGRVSPDPVRVYNLYYLLTYPLTALTAMLVFRWLRLSFPAAAVGALLYAFQPYHHLRWEYHYFLAAYWVVPLSWVPALMIFRGELPLFRQDSAGVWRFRPWSWAAAGQVLLAAATASAGAYYAFFACALYAVAGGYGWAAMRTWRAAAAAALVVAAVGVFGVVNHWPVFPYTAANGKNSVTERDPLEADTYGMKVAQLVLPIDDHRMPAMARLKSRFNSPLRPLNNENAFDSLGLIASAGLLGLLVALFWPGRRGWPLGPLAAVAGATLLFAAIGGFGAVFNLLVFDQVRCYNRVSIYLAFICLFAVLWPLDRFLLTRTGWSRRLRYPAFAALAVIGIADQTPAAWFREPIVHIIEEEGERFWADHRFFTKVEEMLLGGPRNPLDPDGPPKVFTLPYIPFPEVPPLHKMKTYEPIRGYLHTHSVVWSYGAMKNREADAWQREVGAGQPFHVDQLLRRLVARGFDGVVVDKRGFAVTDQNQGDLLVNALLVTAEGATKTRLPVVIHEDRDQVFIDLRPYREWKLKQDPAGFEAEARREREWVAITWIRGFHTTDLHGVNDKFRWVEPAATAVIVNPADRTRRFRFSAEIGTDRTGVFHVAIDGGGLVWADRPGGPGPWADEVALDKGPHDWSDLKYGEKRSYVIEVPPGRHTVRFRCQLPAGYMPGEARDTCYYLRDIKFTEVP